MAFLHQPMPRSRSKLCCWCSSEKQKTEALGGGGVEGGGADHGLVNGGGFPNRSLLEQVSRMKSRCQMLTCSGKSLATLLRELDWIKGRILPGLVECPLD